MQRFECIPALIKYVSQTYSNPKAFNHKIDSEWYSISTEYFVKNIEQIATGLNKMGIVPGESIGIIARPSWSWLVFDVAILMQKAISIPMFHNISLEHFKFEVADGNVQYIYIDKYEEIDNNIISELPKFKAVFTNNPNITGKNVIQIRDLQREGEIELTNNPIQWQNIISTIAPSDPATIIYTSGSTGNPKGVTLSHENLTMQIHGASIRFPIDHEKDSVLSCLPLAHIFERMVMYYYISTGVSIYFVDDVKNVGAYLKEVKPTIITMVPRILEKAFAKIQAKQAKEIGPKKYLLKFALAFAQHSDMNLNSIKYVILNKLVYTKIRELFGGRLRMVIVGGAALFPKIGSFFNNVGIPVYQGYGMTECSPVIASNFPGKNKMGTVGIPFPDVSVKIDSNSEILVSGKSVMMGYHHQIELTQQIFQNGWLRTGDLGEFDSEGFLMIKGRVKELFKTSNGKYVSPLSIEQQLCLTKTIETAVIIADNRKFVSCLVFPDFDILPQLKVKFHKKHLSDLEFIRSPLFFKHVRHIINLLNKQLDHWEQVRAFTIMEHRLTIEGGDLTPTMKLRRYAIEKKFSAIIEAMYPDDSKIESLEESP